MTLWTAQVGNWTAAGKDRWGCGSVARRVTENSPSSFLKQMLSSYSLCTEKQGDTAVRWAPACRYYSSSHTHPSPSSLKVSGKKTSVTEAPGEVPVQEREHLKSSKKAGSEESAQAYSSLCQGTHKHPQNEQLKSTFVSLELF